MKKTTVHWFMILALATAMAHIAATDYGMNTSGETGGGYFWDSTDSGRAWVAAGHYGIQGRGNTMGGLFQDADGSGYAEVGVGDYGIQGYGNRAGGFFEDLDDSGFAYIGASDNGIQAYGSDAGGFFLDRNGSGYANVGVDHTGIRGFGNLAGGYFEDLTSNAFTFVGSSTHKIAGTGTVNFIQNHPTEPEQVIVYTAPEGDEVATYTRGSAVLVDGEARIPLGETFKWVTNPDIGLTAHLTSRGNWAVLYVESLTTEEMVVKASPDSPDDASFDYIVYGLRIGFEETSVVQEKTQEAYIPAMTDHRERYVNYPEFRKYNAMQRYSRMDEDMGRPVRKDMSATQLLRKQIVEFDPAIHSSKEKPPMPALPAPIKPNG